MAKPQIYEHDLYLVRDRYGASHWYIKDPFREEDFDGSEIDIAEELFTTFGRGTLQNPLRVRIGCALMTRCEPFSIAALSDIGQGLVDKHVEDSTGHRVEILKERNGDTDYPLSGVVRLASDGETQTRAYSLKGECSDGDDRHALVVVMNDMKK